LSDNLIPVSAGLKRQAVGGGGGEAQRLQLQTFSVQYCALYFKQWKEVECQNFLTEINYKITQKIVTLTGSILLRNNVFIFPANLIFLECV
jgi:hypothetical protein